MAARCDCGVSSLTIIGTTTNTVLPTALPTTSRATFTPGSGMVAMKGRIRPPRMTVAEAKAPRQTRLEMPAFLRRCEYQPPASTTIMPKIHGRMKRLPPMVWLKPSPSTR